MSERLSGKIGPFLRVYHTIDYMSINVDQPNNEFRFGAFFSPFSSKRFR